MKIIDFSNYTNTQKTNAKSYEERAEDWRKLAYECILTENNIHKWIPTAWSNSGNTKNITELTCTACLHQISMKDLKEYRYNLEG